MTIYGLVPVQNSASNSRKRRIFWFQDRYP